MALNNQNNVLRKLGRARFSVAGSIFVRLYKAFGPQHWWPGRTPFEIIVGAILTQNTAWANVEKAIRRLRRAQLLSPGRMHRAPLPVLLDCIRPAGYFRVKARRLRAFTTFLMEQFGGRLESFFELPTEKMREALLGVYGIGPETADSIILYAARRPVFVVDAYTRRVLARHGWLPGQKYERVQEWFTSQLPTDEKLFNEYHALLVALGKRFCRSKPLCEGCPLQDLLTAKNHESARQRGGR